MQSLAVFTPASPLDSPVPESKIIELDILSVPLFLNLKFATHTQIGIDIELQVGGALPLALPFGVRTFLQAQFTETQRLPTSSPVLTQTRQ